jgi:ApaG protein
VSTESRARTRDVTVRVSSRFVPEQSSPEQGRWFFVYTVRISNDGDETVQLVSRHWVITDATGHVEEVRGPGVVGVQPVLRQGQQFEYTSACPLGTPTGTMRGSYQMVTGDGDSFDAEIAEFALSEPMAFH